MSWLLVPTSKKEPVPVSRPSTQHEKDADAAWLVRQLTLLHAVRTRSAYTSTPQTHLPRARKVNPSPFQFSTWKALSMAAARFSNLLSSTLARASTTTKTTPALMSSLLRRDAHGPRQMRVSRERVSRRCMPGACQSATTTRTLTTDRKRMMNLASCLLRYLEADLPSLARPRWRRTRTRG
jgi:hypothetical protein